MVNYSSSPEGGGGGYSADLAAFLAALAEALRANPNSPNGRDAQLMQLGAPYGAPGLNMQWAQGLLANPSQAQFEPEVMKYGAPSAVQNGGGSYTPEPDPNKQTGAPVAAPVDPAQAILDQMMRQYNQSAGGFDYESALDQVKSQLAAAYAPQINAIRGQNKTTKREEAQNEKAVRKMYGALARFDLRAGDRSQDRANANARALAKLGEATGRQISDATTGQVAAERNLLQGLGLGSAGKNLLGNVQDIGSRAGALAARTSQGAQANARTYGEHQADMLTQLASSDKLEGTNARVDLRQQLADILAGNRSNIAALRGQQAAAVAQAIPQLLGTQADYESQRQDMLQQIFENVTGVQQQQFENQLALQQAQGAGAPTLSNPLMESQQYLAGAVPPKYASTAESILQTLTAEPQFVSGGINNPLNAGEMLKITPEYAMQEIARLAQEKGITDPAIIAALRQAAYNLYG